MKIVVLVGLPGSGKSTYLEGIGATAISSDHVRQLLVNDAANQNIHRRVFATVRYLVRQRFALKMPVTYVDATNLTRWERRPYIRLAQLHDCDAEALFFNVSLETCLRRNRTRPRVVPENAMLEMAARLIVPTIEEGFSKIEGCHSGIIAVPPAYGAADTSMNASAFTCNLRSSALPLRRRRSGAGSAVA